MWSINSSNLFFMDKTDHENAHINYIFKFCCVDTVKPKIMNAPEKCQIIS